MQFRKTIYSRISKQHYYIYTKLLIREIFSCLVNSCNNNKDSALIFDFVFLFVYLFTNKR